VLSFSARLTVAERNLRYLRIQQTIQEILMKIKFKKQQYQTNAEQIFKLISPSTEVKTL